MKAQRFGWLLAGSLALAACGQQEGPAVLEEITVLDDAAVADNVDANLEVVDFGNICKDTLVSRQIRLYAVATNRGNTAPHSGTNIWANNASLSVAGSANPTAIAAGFSTTDGSNLQLPSNWQNYPNKSRSPNRAQPTISFTSSTTGSKSGEITYALAGTGSDSKQPTVTKTATVRVSANVTSCNEAPVINIQSATVEGDTRGGFAFSKFDLIGTASDTEDGTPSVVCTPGVGSVLPVGTTSITCTATDRGGLTHTATGTITVTDTAPPVISGIPSNITEEATGPDGAAASWTAPTAHDLVAGPRLVTCTPASGSTFKIGATTVTCSASDENDNSNSEGFTVTIQDTTAPRLNLPANLSVSATGNSQAIVNYTATATDLVDGSVTPNCTPASGSSFPVGTTPVNCSATDAAGNPASGSFTVSVGYNFGGWQSPLNALPTRNTVKAGRAIPVKFTLGGDQGLSIFNGTAPKSSSISCTPAGTDPVEETSSAGSSSLTYDTVTGQYTYVWKTDSLWAGKCRTLELNLKDGSAHKVEFTFTK